MFNCIKAELYRVLNRKYNYVLLEILIVISIIISIFSSDVNSMKEFYQSELNVVTYFLIPIITFGAFSDEYKFGTLKNSISSGFSRNSIYLSKALIQLILVFSDLFIVITIYFLCISVLRKADIYLLILLLKKLILLIPSFIAIISLVNFFMFSIKNSVIAMYSYFLFIILPTIINATIKVNSSLKFIHNIQLTNCIHNIIYTDTINNSHIVNSTLIPLIYVLIFNIIGMLLFEKKEII